MSQEEPSDRKPDPWPPLNGLACAVKICHDGVLEDTNSLDGTHITAHFLALSQTADYSVTVLRYFVLKDLLYLSVFFFFYVLFVSLF